MKKRPILLPLLLLLLLFSACGTDIFSLNPAGVPHTPSLDRNAEDATDIEVYDDYLEHIQVTTSAVIDDSRREVLRLSMRHPLTLNPLLNEDATVDRILRLIFEPLIILDENLRPTSHLAELEFSPDYSSVTLAIRNDAFWSDGMPVTADDLIFSVDMLRSAPETVIYHANVQNIAGISRINARTVQIRFYNASPLVGIDLNFPIIPRHHYQGQNRNSMTPLGNGPFLFESHTNMRNIMLAQNPASFRTLSHIQNIEVIFLPDAQTELYAFDQGRIDAIYLPLTEWVRHHSVRHPHYEIFPAMYFEFIGFNFRNEIFQNLHMRQGIAHAFNASEAVQAVYLTHAVRATSPIHPNSFMSGNVSGLRYDPVRARALLNAVPVDRPLTIIVNRDNPQRVSMGERLTGALNAIGMPARIEALHYEEYFARLDSGDFDLFIGGMNLALIPDVSIFFKPQEASLFIDDEVLQASFDAMESAGTQADYLTAVTRFQHDFAERLPVIGLAFRHSAVLTSTHITQNRAPAPDNILGWVNLWVIE